MFISTSKILKKMLTTNNRSADNTFQSNQDDKYTRNPAWSQWLYVSVHNCRQTSTDCWDKYREENSSCQSLGHSIRYSKHYTGDTVVRRIPNRSSRKDNPGSSRPTRSPEFAVSLVLFQYYLKINCTHLISVLIYYLIEVFKRTHRQLMGESDLNLTKQCSKSELTA